MFFKVCVICSIVVKCKLNVKIQLVVYELRVKWRLHTSCVCM